MLLDEGLSLKSITDKPRRYIHTYRDTVPTGFPSGVALPADGTVTSFNLNIGQKPAGGTVRFLIGLAPRGGVEEAIYTATINGVPCEVGSDQEEPSKFPGSARVIEFVCPLKAVQDGSNRVVVTQPAGQQIVWAELQTAPLASAP